MGDHMPVDLGAMPLSVRAVREALTLGPGDVALVNDPFRGGTHLPDITAVSGVFAPGSKKASFYLANRAHHADVGGMSPGSMPLARAPPASAHSPVPAIASRRRSCRRLAIAGTGECADAGGARGRSHG